MLLECFIVRSKYFKNQEAMVSCDSQVGPALFGVLFVMAKKSKKRKNDVKTSLVFLIV